MSDYSDDGFVLDEQGREYGHCNSCGEECPVDDPRCDDGEVVPHDG